MKLFKKIHIQFRSGVEELLNNVENHEAVSKAAIQEYQQHYAKGKIKLERMIARQKLIGQQLEKTRQEVENWKNRATQLAHSDRDKAMQCMKRMKAAENEATLKAEEHANIGNAVSEISATVESMRVRIEETKRKHDQLLVRDCNAKIIQSAANAQGDEPMISDVFERWEEKIISKEVQSDEVIHSTDNFQREFEKTELEAQLGSELDALLDSNSNNTINDDNDEK